MKRQYLKPGCDILAVETQQDILRMSVYNEGNKNRIDYADDYCDDDDDESNNDYPVADDNGFLWND